MKVLYAKNNKLGHKFKTRLTLEDYDYNRFFTEEESDDKTLEGDKKEEYADLLPM